MIIDSNDLVGITEIAELANVSRACVCMWAKRHSTFPKPIRALRMGPVYSKLDVLIWLRLELVITSQQFNTQG